VVDLARRFFRQADVASAEASLPHHRGEACSSTAIPTRQKVASVVLVQPHRARFNGATSCRVGRAVSLPHPRKRSKRHREQRGPGMSPARIIRLVRRRPLRCPGGRRAIVPRPALFFSPEATPRQSRPAPRNMTKLSANLATSRGRDQSRGIVALPVGDGPRHRAARCVVVADQRIMRAGDIPRPALFPWRLLLFLGCGRLTATAPTRQEVLQLNRARCG